MKKFIIICLMLFFAASGFSFWEIFNDNIYGKSGNEMIWGGTINLDGATLTLPDTIDGNVLYSDTVTATHFIGNLDAATVTIDTISGNTSCTDTITATTFYGNVIAVDIFADTLQGNTYLDVCNTAQLNASPYAYIDTMQNNTYADSITTPVAIVTNAYIDSIKGDVYADSITAPIINGNVDINGEWNQTYTVTSGANIGNIWKTTLTDADTFSGTNGYQFKVYDGGASVLHNGGEHCGMYVNLKLLSTPTAGGTSVIYSGHNYDSSVEIDAGMWLYGKLEYGLKISGDTINYGIDLSETAVETADFKLENGATIANSSTGKTIVSDTLEAGVLDGPYRGDVTGSNTINGQWFGSGTWTGNTAEAAIYTQGSTTGAIPVVVFSDLITTAGITYTVVADSLYITFNVADTAAATGKTYYYQVLD